MQPYIVIVILNTNNRDDTLTCLASIAQSSYRNYMVLVLDNASTDGSVQAIQAQYPGVTLLRLEENRGYAGNNNVGIQAAVKEGADWVLVLNEDTVVAPDFLDQLVRVATSDSTIGVVGPMVFHFDEPEIIQSAGGLMGRYWQTHHAAQNERDQGQFQRVRDVDWISGCAIMVRQELIHTVGILDERFFYYWEETEWCLRARKAGWRVVHVPQAKLWHKGVQRHYSPGPSVTYYHTRNRFLVLAKHSAPISAWLVALTETGRTLLSWTVKPRWRGQRKHRDAMWQGVCDFLRRRWGIRSNL